MSGHRAGATAFVLAVLLGVATPARAQEAPPASDPAASTTSTSTTSTTVAPSVSTPPTLLPGDPLVPLDPSATTTTLVPPEDDPAANGDAPPETVPPVSITVPPRPPAAAYGNQPPFSAAPGRVVRVSARTARARAAETQAAVDAANDRVNLLTLRRWELEQELLRLGASERRTISALEDAQLRVRQRAADAYIRGTMGGTETLLMSDDASQFAQRSELIEVVVEADQAAVREYNAARDALDDAQLADAEELVHVALDLRAAQEELVYAVQDHELASRELAVFLNGGTLVIHGFAFPVVQPVQYGDSFGAPRMMGTVYEHWHEGTDILAPMGTPLVACERGVIMQVGRGGVLGGNTVWLRGESGVAYYYAHLSAFADGLDAGLVVEAGTVLGFVGDTGNARGGPPHLHFEVHPANGTAINPYPILRASEGQPQPPPISIEESEQRE